MRRLPFLMVLLLVLAMTYSCDRFRQPKLIIFDTICTDTLIGEADQAIYGTIGDKSTMQTLILYTYDDTMVFRLVNPQIIGRYTVGDRVAVVPCGEAMANRVVDITSLMQEWGTRDSLKVPHGFAIEADGKIRAINNNTGRLYHGWELVNGRFVINHNNGKARTDTISDTMDILKLTPDSFVIGDSIHALRYGCIGEKISTSKKKRRR
ncbi:MAG: hypothetical protein IKP43_09285 [Bacteroidaceae bacterium]|nr:hypothetical protein [Bacteroidaceae bacterium]